MISPVSCLLRGGAGGFSIGAPKGILFWACTIPGIRSSTKHAVIMVLNRLECGNMAGFGEQGCNKGYNHCEGLSKFSLMSS